MMLRTVGFVCLAMGVAGCSSMGSLGLVTKSGHDPAAILKGGQAYTEVGQASGSSCRFFLLAVVPWGNGTFSDAVDDALAKSGGDALLNVSVQNSMYGLIPIYNIFSWECTDVRGTAIKFANSTPVQPPAPPTPRS